MSGGVAVQRIVPLSQISGENISVFVAQFAKLLESSCKNIQIATVEFPIFISI